ncbi:MAG: RNA-binding cell elongation regulator Jag/EloR [Bacillota bacterium]
MKEIEKSGKTVEEAVATALAELGLKEDQVTVEVLEESSKGIFGIIGSKAARVKVTEKESPVSKAKKFLSEIFEKMGLNVDITAREVEEYTVLDISGPDLGILIGRRGDTLDAIQYLTNLVANKNIEKRVKIIVDVEGYRKRREETLHKLAFRLAEKAMRKGQDVVLEPMNPHERRVIHTALQGHRDVFTYSEGEEPYRKIVIAPKK